MRVKVKSVRVRVKRMRMKMVGETSLKLFMEGDDLADMSARDTDVGRYF